MKVLSLNDVEPGTGPRTVAIGTFDGVHLGHREVIRGSDTVLTFDPHPLSVIHPEATPKLLNPFPVKRDLIEGLGVEELVVIPFDRGFSEQSAEDFVQDVLIRRLGAERVSVGENFRFGKGARGTADFLRSHDEFETNVTPLVEVEGETVSSTQIRGLVAAGEVKEAAAFLGGPFLFEGVVVEGDRRGRTLEMPTANIVPGRRLRLPRARRVRGVCARPPGRRERRGAPHVRDGPGAAGGGAPDRLRGRPVRPDAPNRVRGADARREAIRIGGRARGADEPRRGGGAGDRRPALDRVRAEDRPAAATVSRR